jgi:hypothetical protein
MTLGPKERARCPMGGATSRCTRLKAKQFTRESTNKFAKSVREG